MLTNEISVPVLRDIECVTLECYRPIVLIIQGIMASGKSVASAWLCAGSPSQPTQEYVTLKDQNPDFPPLHVRVKMGGEDSRFWYVQEETPDLDEYYRALERFKNGIDRVPDPCIAEFQISMMDLRGRQADSDIPQLIEQGLCPGLDGCPFGDYVYAKNLINKRAIQGDLLRKYNSLCEHVFDAWYKMVDKLKIDMVFAYLLAEDPENWPLSEATEMTAKVASERILKRGRGAESGIPLDHLLTLNALQNEMFGINHTCNSDYIFTVNTGTGSEIVPEKEVLLVQDIVRGVAGILPYANYQSY